MLVYDIWDVGICKRKIKHFGIQEKRERHVPLEVSGQWRPGMQRTYEVSL